MSELRQPTPAALYARVSSYRQDIDLSVAAQLRALRSYAEENGYLVAREYVDEAESGRVADRPQFRRILDAAGQMHFYLNYARQLWGREGENPPVGLILGSEKNEARAQYSLEGLPNVMAAEYRIALPGETVLAGELDRTMQTLELCGLTGGQDE